MSDEIWWTMAIFSHVYLVMSILLVGSGKDLNLWGSLLFFSAIISIIYTWVSVFV